MNNDEGCDQFFLCTNVSDKSKDRFDAIWTHLQEQGRFRVPANFCNLKRSQPPPSIGRRRSSRLGTFSSRSSPPVVQTKLSVLDRLRKTPLKVLQELSNSGRRGMEKFGNAINNVLKSPTPKRAKRTHSNGNSNENEKIESKDAATVPPPTFDIDGIQHKDKQQGRQEEHQQPLLPPPRFHCSSESFETISCTPKCNKCLQNDNLIVNLRNQLSIKHNTVLRLSKMVKEQRYELSKQEQQPPKQYRSSDPYVTLKSFNIPTEFCSTHRKLLGELVKLFKVNDEKFTFPFGNNKRGCLALIPCCSDKRSYNAMLQRDHWLLEVLRLSIPDQDDDKRNLKFIPELPDAAEWVSEYLFKLFEFNCRAVAKKNGMITVLKLDPTQLLSLRKAANINESQCREVMKHLKVAFGPYFQVPRKQVLEFSGRFEDHVDITFGSFEYFIDDDKAEHIINHKTTINRGEWLPTASNIGTTTNRSISNQAKKKKTEKIEYWHFDATDAMMLDVQRLIEKECAYVEDVNDLPNYGYPQVDVTIGCDHGAGNSRFVLKTNYLSPETRREIGRLEHGSRIITFGTIKCKKDKASIVKVLAPQVNEIISKLKTQKMIGVLDPCTKKMETVMIPRSSRNLQVVNSNEKLYIQYKAENEVTKKVDLRRLVIHENICIPPCCPPCSTPPLFPNDPQRSKNSFHIWTIIEQFNSYACGDLAWYATIQGRDGCSGGRCPYCDVLIRKGGKESVRGANLLTYSMLEEYAAEYEIYDTALCEAKQKREEEKRRLGKTKTKLPKKGDFKGVKESPQWCLEPRNFIIPILHLEIGLCNFIIVDMKRFLDLNVELVPNEERKARVEYEESLLEERHLKENVELCKEEDSSLREELTDNQADISSIKEEMSTLYQEASGRTHCAFTNQESQQLQQLNTLLVLKTKSLVENKENLDLTRTQKQMEEEVLKKAKRIVLKLKEEWEAQIKKRVGHYEHGLENKLEQLFTKFKIKHEAFHGGGLNGVCCNRFLYNVIDIIDELKTIAFKRLRSGEKQGRCSETDLDKKFETYLRAFEVMDLSFSLLRTINPTDEEIKHAKNAIAVLKNFWLHKLNLNVTPKAHILFEHAVEQFIEHNGLSDKAEDFVEREHQRGKQMEARTSRMSKSTFRGKSLTSINTIFQEDDPQVLANTMKVRNETKRNFKNQNDREANRNKKRQKRKKQRLDLLDEDLFIGIHQNALI